MKLHSEVIINREKQNPARQMLCRLLLGIAVFGMVEECFLLLLCKNRLAATLGLLLGLWIAIVNSIYIYHSIGHALELDEKNSVKAMRISVMIRYCFMGIVVVLALRYPQIFSPIGTILGLLSMKISAYVQPFFMEHNPNVQPLSETVEEEEPSQWGFGVFHNQPEDRQ